MGQAFVKTDTILDKILAQKLLEVQAVEPAFFALVQQSANDAPPARNFAAVLRRATVTLIAEVKKASPSKGILIENFDPVAIGTTYADNGAAAISVLVDQPFFQGHVDYLRAVRAAVLVPVLYKEFVLDEYQVYEARMNQADAVLLIVAALEDARLRDLQQMITGLGMTALVEVHTEAELERALKIGASVIGINNRDLKTFHTDLAVTERLARLVPPEITLVAESGIAHADDVRRMGELGAHAVLVGEALMKSGATLAERVRDFSSQTRRQE